MQDWQTQAHTLMDQQDYTQAIARYEQAIATDPQNLLNYWYLGLSLLLQGNLEEAEATWFSALAQPSQQDGEPILQLVEILNQESLNQEARNNLPVALQLRQYIRELVPETLNNLLAICDLAFALEGLQAEARTTLLKASQLLIESDPNLPLDCDRICKIFTYLIPENPYHDLIEISLQHPQINSHLSQYPEIKTKLALAYNNLGFFQFQQHHYDQALATFEKILTLQPEFTPEDTAKIYLNLGSVWLEKGNLELALTYFQKALDLNSNSPQISEKMIRSQYSFLIQVRGYEFTSDWFSRNLVHWNQYVKKFAEQADLQVLEIGSWEGRSTCWFLDNILTHETAKITCIDTFEGSLEHHDYFKFEASYIRSVEARFDHNIQKSGQAQKVIKRVERSQSLLRRLPENTYDLIYVDGSHIAYDVLEDIILSWGLLKVGGMMILDDYDFTFPNRREIDTAVGINAFLNVFQSQLKILYKSYQVLIEKITP